MISTLPLTFVTIVEQGSITLAADKLDIAKSAVSQNLKRLENQLGVMLANRTTRSLSLTPAGEQYYLRCKEMLSLAKVASTEMENFGVSPSGPISITAPHAMVASIIAPAISALISRYPKLYPTVIADDERIDLISEGIDIAISVGSLNDSNLKAKRVGTLRDVLCVSSKLMKQSKISNSPAEKSAIQALPYIAHARENSSIEHKLTSTKPTHAILVKFTPTLFGNTIETLLSLVREGLGVALLPDFLVAEELKSGKLIRLFPDHGLPENPIYAVHPYANMPPKSILEVIKAIQNELKQ
ncbi:MAG: DNA-binding transcriptional LysR family regulator [Chitinophagales bacterium]|jgi:DNA-binding transcriptional LysR family regulator